jgi:signal transduction histidine kinase
VRELPRSVWEEPRPQHPPPLGWRDWGLVGVLVPVAVLEGILRPGLSWRAVAVTITVGLVPTVLWRRTRPLLMVAIAFGITGVAAASTHDASDQMYALAYLVLLPYSLFRWGSGRDAVIGSLIVAAKAGASVAFGHLDLAGAIGAAAVLFATAALGVAFRYRARARRRELDQVKLVERERLARDLHDTVAHHVSAIAIRAQAGLAVSASEPSAADDALRLIEAEASRALAEMRTMVRLLRTDQPAELAPNPGIPDLERLAGRSRSGPSVEVEILGDLDGLAPTVGTAIYRLAQESITNARRHARHATRIEVHVAVDETSVRLRVRDDGETSSRRQAAPPGFGLVGMFERAGLLGGTCEAGPDPDRGWTVSAVLPRTSVKESA